MSLEGKMLIGRDAVSGSSKPINAVNPATGETLEPTYPGGSAVEVERACELAEGAFATYRETTLEERAAFLEAMASEIEAIGDELIERAINESGLPRARLEGERGRTR